MALTPPHELDDLATALDRHAGELDRVRDELRQAVQDTRGGWEGLVADRFRAHLDGRHRQHHLAHAADRLRDTARLARLAADEQRDRLATAQTGGTPAP
ncbi:hypothetical protein [Dactylosporangium sp. NPDC000521]|uniref:hypothetical protein n=1 Tax=Dactylosporangium sp. NPDC000521 TaxID=3363975 RepID=UPI0036CD27D0